MVTPKKLKKGRVMNYGGTIIATGGGWMIATILSFVFEKCIVGIVLIILALALFSIIKLRKGERALRNR